VGGAASVDTDQVQLTMIPAFVSPGEPLDDLLRPQALGQAVQRGRRIERIDQGLGGHGADAAARMRTKRADREEPAGDGAAEGAGGVARDDRPGHGEFDVRAPSA